jgi:hypothetical protein
MERDREKMRREGMIQESDYKLSDNRVSQS